MLYGFWSVRLRWNIITVRGQNVRKRKGSEYCTRYLDNEIHKESEWEHIYVTPFYYRLFRPEEEVRSELYIYQDTNDKPKQAVTKSPQEKRINSQLIDKVTLNWAHAATTQMKQTHTQRERERERENDFNAGANYICHSTNLPFHELEQIRWTVFFPLCRCLFLDFEFVSRFRVWFQFILITCPSVQFGRIELHFLQP